MSAVWSKEIIPYSHEEAIAHQEVIGNLISGGSYVVEHEGLYYYFDDIDGQKGLYRIDAEIENKYFLTQAASFIFPDIQFYDNKLFFNLYPGHPLNASSTVDQSSLFSYDLEKGELVELNDEKLAINSFVINSGYIYFTTYWDMGNNTNGSAYRMKTDGSELTWLAEFDYHRGDLQVLNEKLYLLSGFRETIITMNLDGTDIQTYDLDHHNLMIYGDSFFYTDDKDYVFGQPDPYEGGLYKKSLSDIDAEAVELVQGEVVTFTISDNTIYFAAFLKDSVKHQQIYRIDLDGNNLEYIVDGNCPNVVGDYLFFTGADQWGNVGFIKLNGDREGFLTERRFELPTYEYGE